MSYEILTSTLLKQNLNHSQHNATRYGRQQRDSRPTFPRTTSAPGPPLGPPLKQIRLEVLAYNHTMVSAKWDNIDFSTDRLIIL